MVRKLLIFSIWLPLVTAYTVNAQWVQTSGPHCTVIVDCMAVSGNAIFAGTGHGIFRSTDTGATWNTVNSGLTDTDLYALAVSGNNIYAGTLYTIFFSTNNGESWTEIGSNCPNLHLLTLTVDGDAVFAAGGRGAFRSTDFGASWTEIHFGLMDSTGRCPSVNALAVSEGALFAGTQDGIFRSTDSGSTWTMVNSGITDTIVMKLAAGDSAIFAGSLDGGIFRSTDNGTTWTALHPGLPDSLDEYFQVLSFLVTSDTVFIGTREGIFRSTDNGTTWTGVNAGIPETKYGYVPVYSLAKSDGVFYAGTYAGLFRSFDNGTSWAEVDFNIVNSKVLELAAIGGIVIAGTYDIFEADVFRSVDNGASWNAVNSGLPSCFPHCFAANGSNLYLGTPGGVYLSTDSGASWKTVDSSFTWSLAVNNGTVIAGSQTWISHSTDNGSSWTRSDSGLEKYEVDFDHLTGIGGTFIATVLDYISPRGAGIIRSTDSGISWNLVEDSTISIDGPFAAIGNTFLANGSYHIAADGEKSTLYSGGVCLSTDTGRSWIKLDSSVLVSVGSFAVHDSIVFAVMGAPGYYITYENGTGEYSTSLNRDSIFKIYNVRAGASGLFLSTDTGRSWTAVDHGLPHELGISSLAVCNNMLFAGTNRAGVWRRPISEMTGIIKRSRRREPVRRNRFQVRPVSSAGSVIIFELTLPSIAMATVAAYDLAGRKITTIVNRKLGAGTYRYSWDTHVLARGCYMVRGQAGPNTCVKRIQTMH